MTHFPPEEQAAYEADLRAQFEANDYEEIKFAGQGGDYTAVLISDGTTIYDDCGYVVMRLSNGYIDDIEELKRMVLVYRIGYVEGFSKGRDKLAAEIRKALGVSNG